MIIKNSIEKGKKIIFVTFFEVLKIREVSTILLFVVYNLIRTIYGIYMSFYAIYAIIRPLHAH